MRDLPLAPYVFTSIRQPAGNGTPASATHCLLFTKVSTIGFPSQKFTRLVNPMSVLSNSSDKIFVVYMNVTSFYCSSFKVHHVAMYPCATVLCVLLTLLCPTRNECVSASITCVHSKHSLTAGCSAESVTITTAVMQVSHSSSKTYVTGCFTASCMHLSQVDSPGASMFCPDFSPDCFAAAAAAAGWPAHGTKL